MKSKFNRNKIKLKIRANMSGAPEKPRVTVFRSLKYIYLQAVDDLDGKTICSFSSHSKENQLKNNKVTAKTVGESFGKLLKEKGISKIVFDRNGYRYHGRIKEVADGMRSTGLDF